MKTDFTLKVSVEYSGNLAEVKKKTCRHLEWLESACFSVIKEECFSIKKVKAEVVE